MNIATLYQYFSNKESIFAELARRHVTATRASALAVLSSSSGRGLEATVRAMIEMAIAAHRVQPALHRIFTEEMPRLGLGRLEAPADVALQRESAAWLEASRASIEEPELAFWMVDTAVHAIVHQAIVERPLDFTRPLFAAELTRLVVRFLRRPPLAKKPTRRARD